MSGTIAIAILAAGEGSRFGGAKLDAPLRGLPLGRHALDAALALGAGKPVLVVGDPAPRFAAEAAAEGLADLILNPAASSGLGGSVALAARHAAVAGAEGLLLLLADMPLVSAASLHLLAQAAAPGRPAATQHPDGRPGIPACFPADFYERLQALAGNRQGAGALLRSEPGTRLLSLPEEELADVDTPADLARIATTCKA